MTGFVQDLFRSRDELRAENAAFRQQLIVAARGVKRPAFQSWERALLVALSSRLQNSRDTNAAVYREAFGARLVEHQSL